jgi:hypothetical protein
MGIKDKNKPGKVLMRCLWCGRKKWGVANPS